MVMRKAKLIICLALWVPYPDGDYLKKLPRKVQIFYNLYLYQYWHMRDVIMLTDDLSTLILKYNFVREIMMAKMLVPGILVDRLSCTGVAGTC